MTIVIGAREARRRFADLLGRVGYGGEVAIVERSGKPMVAIIPLEVYEQMVAQREERFRALERIRQNLPATTPVEIIQDIEQAIQELRSNNPPMRQYGR
jgi:prevent-host-death family protein